MNATATDVDVESIAHLDHEVACQAIFDKRKCDAPAAFLMRGHGHVFNHVGRPGGTHGLVLERFVCPDHLSMITGHFDRIRGLQCSRCDLVFTVFSDFVHKVVSL